MKESNSTINDHVIVDIAVASKRDYKSTISDKNLEQNEHFLIYARKNFHSEGFKTILGLINTIFGILMVAASTVIAQNRVFHMKNHPPLPDVVLDRVKYQDWALASCETVAMVMTMIWILVIFFSKERLTLVKRFFYIVANLLFLRAVTIIVTAIPLIDVHRSIPFKEFVTYEQKISRTLQVAFSFALSLNNSKDNLTYGDYIFSGHILTITILFNFINYYTHKSLWPVKIVTWCLFLSSIPLMLVAHGHYTIDVILAAFIATIYFNNYHTHLELLSSHENSQSLIQTILFPFFRFFEANHIKITYNQDNLFSKVLNKMCIKHNL